MKNRYQKIASEVLLSLMVFITFSQTAKAQINKTMKNKVLFVVTSHDKKGNTGEPTGFYLAEVSHPWEVLINEGYEIDFVSPKGGKAPVDGLNLGDEINKKFWTNKVYRDKIENTLRPSQVNASNYAAIYYAGGHGAMWDFADNAELAVLAAKIYENNGVVGAVCHGPAGLVNIKLSNGKYLVDGKKINAFSNEEEAAVKLDKIVPFLLETKLIERGAKFEKSGLWQPHIVADQRIVTGQNPQSAKGVGEAILDQLKINNVFGKHTQFEVEESKLSAFQIALANYVRKAEKTDKNIVAEIYFEEEKPTTLWLIERWENEAAYNKFSNSETAKNLNPKNEIKKTAYTVRDLMPLTKSEWRTPANKADTPLVIMLFVDAKPGTENEFKTKYNVAMPQFRSEPGVIAYQLSQDVNNEEVFITFEKFRNKDAFQYHLNFPPIKPVLDYLNTSIKQQPFQRGLHTLIPLNTSK